jgi:IS5 family transposase
VAITSHFLKFQAQAAIKTLISSPTCPLSRFLESLKIYSLHEPDVYVIAKGKDHKQYEYGNKVSIVSTKDTNIIVGVARHDKNIHDSKTLNVAISYANSNRNKPIKQAVCDRGYVGAKVVLGANIPPILPTI